MFETSKALGVTPDNIVTDDKYKSDYAEWLKKPPVEKGF
jgi:hypothetical protein